MELNRRSPLSQLTEPLTQIETSKLMIMKRIKLLIGIIAILAHWYCNASPEYTTGDMQSITNSEQITLVTDNMTTSKVEIIMTPSTNILFTNIHQAVAIMIVDMTGKEVIKGQGTFFDISGLPPGVYVLKMQTTSGIHSAKRLVKK